MGIWLAMASANGPERLFAINKERTLIGRTAHCDVRVPMPTIGGKHCEIIACRGRLRIRDLGSDLGTLVNGERISERVLHKSDHIQLGPVTFILRNGKQPPRGGSAASA